MMPEPVNKDSRGERILGRGEPLSQCSATAGRFSPLKRHRSNRGARGGEHLGKCGQHQVQLLARFTTAEYVCCRHPARWIDRCHHGQWRLGFIIGKVGEFRLNLFELEAIPGSAGDRHVNRLLGHLEDSVGLCDQPRLARRPLLGYFSDRRPNGPRQSRQQ